MNRVLVLGHDDMCDDLCRIQIITPSASCLTDYLFSGLPNDLTVPLEVGLYQSSAGR